MAITDEVLNELMKGYEKPEGEKPRPVDGRVLASTPPVVFDPIHGSRLAPLPRPAPDSETASSVYSYLDTAPIDWFSASRGTALPLQYKNSVKMRTFRLTRFTFT